MHIEPGIVEGAKMTLGVATAAGAAGYTVRLALEMARRDGVTSLAARVLIASVLVLCFFQVLPRYPVGVSEVHFILGSTLFLLFGAAPAAIGLAVGLLAQGLVFSPWDLPQYGMNVTTLLVPLFAVSALAQRIIPANTAYKDVTYSQALKLSTAFQGGVVLWVGFWAFYGYGATAETLTSVATFGAAYLGVILIEPVLDLGLLAAVKSLSGASENKLFQARLTRAA